MLGGNVGNDVWVREPGFRGVTPPGSINCLNVSRSNGCSVLPLPVRSPREGVWFVAAFESLAALLATRVADEVRGA